MGSYFLYILVIGHIFKNGTNKKAENNNRDDIYELISQTPGIRNCDIAHILDLDYSLARYHTKKMEQEKMVSKRIDGKYNRYYPADPIERHHIKFVSKVQRQIYEILKEEGPMSVAEICATIDRSKQIVSHHLNNMMKQHCIIRRKSDGCYRYSIAIVD